MTLTLPQLMAFKAVLEAEFDIVKWSPSYDQLQKMYKEVVGSPASRKKRDIFHAIQAIYGEQIRIMIFEGLDTSTTSTLLARASTAVKENGDKKGA